MAATLLTRNPRRLTAARTTRRVLADLIRATERQHPVTLRYTSAKGETKVRTVEPHRVYVDGKGRFLVDAWCRFRQARRTFAVDAVEAYTVHSRCGRFVGEQPEEAPFLVLPEGAEARAAYYADRHDEAEAAGDEKAAAFTWKMAVACWSDANREVRRAEQDKMVPGARVAVANEQTGEVTEGLVFYRSEVTEGILRGLPVLRCVTDRGRMLNTPLGPNVRLLRTAPLPGHPLGLLVG